MCHLKTIVAAALMVLITAPLLAYSIYLKDGSRLIAKEKYTIEDGKAIIVLQNGTQTFIDLSEIDIPHTDEANEGRYGTAWVIEDGKLTEAPIAQPDEKQTLTDVSRRDEAAARTRPRATRETVVEQPQTNDVRRTTSGVVDLAVFPRTPYRNLEVSGETSRFLKALGVEEFHIYQGTDQKRAFLEVITNSEASVFRGIEAAADTLLHLRNSYSDQIESFEVLLVTANRERAGQFLLTPESASELADESLDASVFFISNVQF